MMAHLSTAEARTLARMAESAGENAADPEKREACLARARHWRRMADGAGREEPPTSLDGAYTHDSEGNLVLLSTLPPQERARRLGRGA